MPLSCRCALSRSTDFGYGAAGQLQIDRQVGRDRVAGPDGLDPVGLDGGLDHLEVVLGELGGRDDQDHAGVEHQVGDLGQAPHVLQPVLRLALDVGVHAVEHAADAEEVDHLAVLEQLALERLGDALPVGVVLAGDQDERGLLVVLLGPPLGLDDAGLPLVVAEQHLVAHGGLAVGQRLADDAAAADLEVVDDHEAAGGRDVRRQVARDGAVELEDALGHVVPLHGGPLLGGVERRGVHHAEDLLDPGGDPGRAQLEQILLALHHRLLAEPEEAHPEPGGDLRRGSCLERRHLAARDVDLLLQREARPPGRPPPGSAPAG